MMVTVAPGRTPPDASVTVPRRVAVPCAAAVAGVPSANTVTSTAHARPRIVVLSRLPSCTGFSPQKWMWPNQTIASGRSITKALLDRQGGKLHVFGRLERSERRGQPLLPTVSNLPNHQKILAGIDWIYHFEHEPFVT